MLGLLLKVLSIILLSRFKLDINKLDSGSLRLQPIGRDKLGNCYWFQLDPEANVRVYR